MKNLKSKHILIPLFGAIILFAVYYLLNSRKRVASPSAGLQPTGNVPTLTMVPYKGKETPDITWTNALETYSTIGGNTKGSDSMYSQLNIQNPAGGAIDMSTISYNVKPSQTVNVAVAPVPPSSDCGCGAPTSCAPVCNVGTRNIDGQGCLTSYDRIVQNQDPGYWQNYVSNVLSSVSSNIYTDATRLTGGNDEVGPSQS